MDKSEPALVPEWLKSGGGANNPSASAFLHSDHSLSKHVESKSSLSGGDCDTRHISFLERTTSAYFRRSSNINGSSHLRATGSFGRNSLSRSQRDRDWDDLSDYHDKEKLVLGDYRQNEYSDPRSNILPSKFDKDKLRCSQSMIAGKQDDTWSKKVAVNLSNTNTAYSNGNGMPARVGIRAVCDTIFEQDFPSLGPEENQGSLGRVSSPGLTTGIHPGNLDGGGSTTGVVSAQQPVPATSASPLPNITTGLNMAEALAQGSPRARTPPQSTSGVQRFEELAIRQAKLIPMTPSTPKALAVSPSEKSKPKTGLQQSSVHFANHSRAPARPDSPKLSSEGRLQVLKPSRELNSVSAAAAVKDSFTPTNGSKTVNSPLGSSVLAASGSVAFGNSAHSPNNVTVERYPSVFRPTAEKRPTFQVQSRSDFFNHLKKKSSVNSTSVVLDPGPVSLTPASEKSGESIPQVAAAAALVTGHGEGSPSSDFSAGEKIDKIVHNGDVCDDQQQFVNGEKDSSYDVTPNPDEEEAAFLRSLGWEENAEADEGLTEEEIKAFCEKYKAKMPSTKVVHGIQLIMTRDSCNGSSGVASCSPSSCESELDS